MRQKLIVILTLHRLHSFVNKFSIFKENCRAAKSFLSTIISILTQAWLPVYKIYRSGNQLVLDIPTLNSMVLSKFRGLSKNWKSSKLIEPRRKSVWRSFNSNLNRPMTKMRRIKLSTSKLRKREIPFASIWSNWSRYSSAETFMMRS
jgi:hypothetical protein